MTHALPRERQHVTTGECRDGQEHLVYLILLCSLVQIVYPKQVIRHQADKHDEHKAKVFHLDPELLLEATGGAVFACE